MSGTIYLDEATRRFVEMLAEHQKVKPSHPDDYAANVEWVMRERDAWQRTDDALRLIVGGRLVGAVLGQGVSSDE